MSNAIWYWVETDVAAQMHGAEPRSELTDSRDEALTYAERWASEIIANLRNDYPEIVERIFNGGTRYEISVTDSGTASRTVTVRHQCAPNPIECAECHGLA